MSRAVQSREDGALAPAEIARAWQAAPVAVRIQQSESGRLVPSTRGFATALFDGADLARLEWNRWVLQLPDSPTPTRLTPFSGGYIALQNGAELHSLT